MSEEVSNNRSEESGLIHELQEPTTIVSGTVRRLWLADEAGRILSGADIVEQGYGDMESMGGS